MLLPHSMCIKGQVIMLGGTSYFYLYSGYSYNKNSALLLEASMYQLSVCLESHIST